MLLDPINLSSEEDHRWLQRWASQPNNELPNRTSYTQILSQIVDIQDMNITGVMKWPQYARSLQRLIRSCWNGEHLSFLHVGRDGVTSVPVNEVWSFGGGSRWLMKTICRMTKLIWGRRLTLRLYNTTPLQPQNLFKAFDFERCLNLKRFEIMTFFWLSQETQRNLR